MRVIDSHIHLDMYRKEERTALLNNLQTDQVDKLICVSNDYASALKNLQLSHENNRIKPAFGFHPEQVLPAPSEIKKITQLMKKYQHEMIAVGEVGLPYYLRKDDPTISIEPYMKLLEKFIQMAIDLNKPIVLHAIYDDAVIACDLLEKFNVQKAHFHWFKGNEVALERIINNGYVISLHLMFFINKPSKILLNEHPSTL